MNIKGEIMKPYIEKSEKFHALLTNAMRRGAAEKEIDIAKTSPTAAGQISDLWRLKEAGAISLEEFEQEKRKILR